MGSDEVREDDDKNEDKAADGGECGVGGEGASREMKEMRMGWMLEGGRV